MAGLEDKIEREMALEKKRREIVELYKQGKTHKEIAQIYKMSQIGVIQLLRTCRAFNYISDEEYRACACKHLADNFKGRIK
jgi:intein-encoded DNA endonuclease-like protein